VSWLLLTVGLLGGLAAATGVESRRLEARFPPIGDYRIVDGLRLHFTDSEARGRIGARSDGPTVVLVHGASTSLLDFHASLVEPLSDGLRVVTVDRPGHGYSERPTGNWHDPAVQATAIHGLLRELQIHRPILVGHSLAGAVVLAYLLDYPDEAAGGVLLAGGSHAWEGGVSWYNDLAGVPILGPLFAHTVPMTVGRLTVSAGIASAFAPNPVPPGYRRRTGIELTLRPRTFLANAEDIRLLSPFLDRQSPRYADLSPPLLLITGDADRVVPAWNHAERLVRQAPNVKLIVLENIGHGLHHVQSAEIAALIENFARKNWQ
jgi:pimeloyl-ACP methyl ester carboxylesterase